MANAFTSTALLASLKRRGLIPTSTSAFATADFYKIVDDEMQTYVVPFLMGVHEEYLVAYSDATLDGNTSEIDIPERAIGGKLRQVTISDGSGGYRPLTRLEPENAAGVVALTSPSGGCFYLRGNKIVLVGPAPTGTLRLHYYQRPNRIVATTAAGEVTAINTTTGLVTVSTTVPDTFTTLVTYDLVRGKPGFDTLAKDLTPTAVGTTDITFSASSLPTGFAVGDFVCLSQETPVAQIPVEVHPLLVERVTATVLHALGDPKAEIAYKVAEDMEKRVLKLVSSRTEGQARYFVNRYGLGQRNRTFFRRGW